MKILIVEDSEVTQELLTDELARIPGVELCGLAHNPDEALRLIQEKCPDLVILDIVLKGGNGFEVLQRIRRDGLQVSVLVLTNYSFPQYREICKGMGADYFFDKSMELDRAILTVREKACA